MQLYQPVAPRMQRLYLVIGILIVCDVMTTYTAKVVLGPRFGEMGLIANSLMKTFGSNWPVAMFLAEFAVFGVTTYWYAKGDRVMKLFRLKVPMAYLPALALLALVANNSTVILAFKAFLQ